MARVERHGATTLTIDDVRLAALLRTIATVPDVRVGIIGSEAAEQHAESGGGQTVAEVAAQHELGAGVPRRSWLRDWVSEQQSGFIRTHWVKALQALAADGNHALHLGRLGAYFVGDIKQRIARGILPPNSPATIARKGSSKPLIDTGQLRNSITSVVE
jgi:hypothetical protein